MLTTRTTRSSRPARRPMTRAALVLVLLVCAVFAHGGACAAVELSEPVAHGADLAGDFAHSADPTSVAAHGAGLVGRAARGADLVGGVVHSVECLHRKLPVRHQHGTEQDCSAVSPVYAPLCLAMSALCAASAAEVAAGAPVAQARPSVFATPCLENLCVMRI
ncbi:hypothetical protein ABZ897_61120 [Nonomuraea sp. NPDC046802]|uniref:hypothetical protein n=1 Tax=Nonomuraea sp. NPDC046802 TaxID=3154919 RepID=UPI0033E0438C